MALRRDLRRRDEAGYALVFVAMLASVLFLGMAAVGVDTARWYVEVERVQKAADAAALAGVTHMPNNFTKARATALEVAAKNGYDDASADVTVTVGVGSKPSELLVTVSSRVTNTFGRGIGVDTAWITRSAVADYTAPAPMGSPCNTFGNEPPGGSGGPAPTGATTSLPPSATRFPNCPVGPTGDQNPGMSSPKFWAAIEGPETDKIQGDRYQALKCTEDSQTNWTDPRTYGCPGSTNSEYKQQGYYFVIHVEPNAANVPIDIQVYDPAFVPSGLQCESNPSSGLSNSMNDYVNDGTSRYSRYRSTSSATSTLINAAAKKFCTGEFFPGASIKTRGVVTTFVMRNRTETNNPDKATAMAACPAKQFRGFTSAPTAASLNETSSTYNDQLAQVYHQWVSVCTFTPPVAGDYYLQVRSNVSLDGSWTSNTKGNPPVIYTGNAQASKPDGNYFQGAGANAYAVRAVPQPVSNTSLRDDVSVSAFERMPILQIAASPATFNLVRALPNAKGQYLTFDFFDAADGSDGYVKVLPPPDATGSVKATAGIPGCKAGKNDALPQDYADLSGCQMRVTGTNTDGQLIHMVIPIPTDYNCGAAPMNLGHCWFQVSLTGFGATVTDFTTWSGNIGGDPVRLIE